MNFLDCHFLEFYNFGDCCILLHQMGQFHGWFWRVGKTKKIQAKMRVRKIHPEFIQNSLQNSFRNSPKIHPRIYSEIHDDNLKIHLEFTARDSSRDDGGGRAATAASCGGGAVRRRRLYNGWLGVARPLNKTIAGRSDPSKALPPQH